MIIITASATEQIQSIDGAVLKQSPAGVEVTLIYPNKHAVNYHARRIIGVLDEKTKTFFDIAQSEISNVSKVAQGFKVTLSCIVIRRFLYNSWSRESLAPNTSIGSKMWVCSFAYFATNTTLNQQQLDLNIGGVRKLLCNAFGGNGLAKIEGVKVNPQGLKMHTLESFPSGRGWTSASEDFGMRQYLQNNNDYVKTVQSTDCLIII